MKNKGDKEGKMVRKRGGTKPTFIDIPEGQVSWSHCSRPRL